MRTGTDSCGNFFPKARSLLPLRRPTLIGLYGSSMTDRANGSAMRRHGKFLGSVAIQIRTQEDANVRLSWYDKLCFN